ncbi:MAG: ABC transporter permease [Thermomicrobiales bacterium]|nr:ABC transporter permease [Thermomicrobiales bacterium]
MSQFLARRLLAIVFMLFGMSVLVFGAMRLLPGDIVNLMVGMQSSASAEQREAIEGQYGLDRPLVFQYTDWMGGVIRGDLGKSMRSQEPISHEIRRKLPVTLELTFLSLIFAVVVAVPLGIISAIRRNSPVDLFARILGVLGLAIPNFWLAIMLLLIASRYFHWLPSPVFTPFFDDPIENLQQMWMPAIALGMVMMANLMRMTRSIMLDVMGQDYIRVARAKGLSEWGVVVKHAIKNAGIPVITLIGMNAGYLLGGTVIIEQIFGLPGIGWMITNAIFQRDYTTVQSAVLITGLLFALVNLCVDVAYALLDPRIRFA